MYGYIYKTTNILNGKIYIGQKKSNTFLQTKYLGSGKSLKYAIAKYGRENFKVELLEECETKEKLDLQEIYWIAYYNSTNQKIGYNMTNGGTGGDTWAKNNHKEETISKMLQTKKELGSNKLSEETKKKIGDANRGINNGMYGKFGKDNPNFGRKITEETRQKLRVSHLGHSPGNKGIPMSPETKEKCRLAKIGKKCPNKKGKAVRCIETLAEYISAAAAARATNICVVNIQYVCNGKRKTAGGYHWEFIDKKGSD